MGRVGLVALPLPPLPFPVLLLPPLLGPGDAALLRLPEDDAGDVHFRWSGEEAGLLEHALPAAAAATLADMLL